MARIRPATLRECVFFGDCRNAMWGDADVMITDPPYDAAVHKNATSQSTGRGARHRDLGFEPMTHELRKLVCKQAANVNRWSVIFTDIESVTLWKVGLEEAGATYIRAIPWVRWSMPSLCKWPPQGAELLVVAYGRGRGRKRWNGYGNLTHFDHKCLRGEGKHKTEKPLDLMLDLVSWFSDPGELVLDPFTGSGTTGVAAKMLGRGFQGVENDPVWVKFAMDRIAQVPLLSKRDEERRRRWVAAGSGKRALKMHQGARAWPEKQVVG